MAEQSAEAAAENTDPWGDGLTEEEKALMAEQAEAPEPEDEPEEEPEGEIAEGTEEAPEVEEPGGESDKEEKTVPYNALHEERQRRKELKEELDQQRERAAKMEERLQQIVERFEKPDKEEPKLSFEDNPAEYLKAEAERTGQTVQELREQIESRQKQDEEAQQFHGFVNNYRQAAQQFAQSHPDFQEAYQFAVQSRIKEYQAAGYSLEEATHAVHTDEINIARRAFNDGVNPAERIMEMSKARGFKPSAKPESGEETIQRLQKGTKAAKSMKGKPEPHMSLEALAEMPDDEFNKHWDMIVGGGKKAAF